MVNPDMLAPIQAGIMKNIDLPPPVPMMISVESWPEQMVSSPAFCMLLSSASSLPVTILNARVLSAFLTILCLV